MRIKISTKINLIKNLIPKFDNIIIVGGMANNILSYKGNSIGKSIKEENCEKEIENIFKVSNDHSCSIIYPKDVKIGKSMDDKSQIKDLTEVSADDLILDIGPKTLKKSEILSKIVKLFCGMVPQVILKILILL